MRDRQAGAAKQALLGLVAGGGLVAVLGVLLLAQVQQANQLRQQLLLNQQQLSQLDAQHRELTHQYDALASERQQLEERLSSIRQQLASATEELQRSEGSLQEMQGRYEGIEQERALLQSQVSTLTGERNSAREQAKRLEQEKAELNRSLSRMRDRMALLDRDYRKMAEKVAELESRPHPGVDVVASIDSISGVAGRLGAASAAPPSGIPGAVELPPIVVRKDQSPSGMMSSLRGRLLEVNDAHRFVVVDKGSEDGVQIGTTFDVIRGSTTVGRATAVRVHPRLSACDVVPARTPGPLQIGDLAIQSSP
jgi:archaellum component FlaC